jgi:dTDP-4-dehydrorhamnose reductase
MIERIGITGPRGRLGSVLVQMGGIPLDVDICDGLALHMAIKKAAPDIIIHTAAYTDVDKAESEPERAFQVNVHGTHNLRQAYDKKIILLSTDYIFDGKSGPYSEEAKVNPQSWYGLSKMSAENMIDSTDVIVRTTGLYGNWNKPDFVQKILEQAENGQSIDLLDKVTTSPTNVHHLAEALLELVMVIDRGEYPHILNLSGNTVLSPYEFARMALAAFGLNPAACRRVDQITRPAKRPQRGGFKLDKARSLGLPLYTAAAGLGKMYKESLYVKENK